MKRPLAILLLLSLAANAAFLIRASRSVSTPSRTAPYPVSPDSHSAQINDQPRPAPAFSTTDWSSLQESSPRARTFLRQLGLSDPEIRAIVRAEVDARYAARERALRKAPAYWEHMFSPQSPSSRETLTDPAAAHALALQKENELRQLLGDAYEPADARLRQYASYLPFEKAWRLKLINDDYQLLRAEIQGRGTPLRLPNSPEQAHYLRDQQRADIEALLTPDELRAHDLRNSDTAGILRHLAGFNATEQEFLALYDLTKPLEAGPNSPPRDPGRIPEFLETKKRIEREIHTLLGEKRYTEYQRAQDHDFRTNYDLATNLGLPPETALAGYEHLKSLKARSAAFTAQNKPTREQRDVFHDQLLRESESTLRTLYGEKGAADARNHFLLRLSRATRPNDP